MTPGSAREPRYLLQDCEAGDQDACETLAKEDEAKKAWLGKHETRYVNPDVTRSRLQFGCKLAGTQ